MNLPDKVYEVKLIELSEKQLKAYRELEVFLRTEIEDKLGRGETVSVLSVLALNMKLAEAANGWFYDKNGVPILFPENPKVDAVMECIDDADDGASKFVIWSQFKQDMRMLRDEISKQYGPDTVRVIDGSVYFEERHRIQTRFNDKKDTLRFVICNVLAAGTGIDLIGASYEIYFSNSFRKVERSQSEDRCHRPGMQNKLTIIDIIAKDTVDEKVIAALQTNKNMNVALTENLGFDPRIILNMENLSEEEAVIKQNGNGSKRKHHRQRKDECLLSAIAMASNTDIEIIRDEAAKLTNGEEWASWVRNGNHETIVKLMRKFLGDGIAEQYEKYKNKYKHVNELEDKERVEAFKKIKLDMTHINIPTAGRGFIIINVINAGAAHIVYYENGWIYDSALSDKKTVGSWTASLGDVDAYVAWVGEL